MKLILKSEVDHLGLPGDLVEVADGYGRNFLIPRGKAIIATKGAMKEAEALTRARKAREAQTVDAAKSSKDVLESRTLRIPVRVDDRGGLYGSVSANDVQRVLKERGHDIPRKRIDLRGTIKEIGSYEIPVQVHPQVVATVTIEVVDEEGKIVVNAGGAIVDTEAIADAEAVAAAAAEVAEDTETDADVLAEQAIEAATAYEAEQAAAAQVEADAAEASDEVADETTEDPDQV
jgi:large subunit ribosomal protein L9